MTSIREFGLFSVPTPADRQCIVRIADGGGRLYECGFKIHMLDPPHILANRLRAMADAIDNTLTRIES